MARYSRSAWPAISAASCTINRVRASRVPCCSTSSKAKLSKYSISSGSVVARVETCSGNSSSWWRRAASVMAMIDLLWWWTAQGRSMALATCRSPGTATGLTHTTHLSLLGVDVLLPYGFEHARPAADGTGTDRAPQRATRSPCAAQLSRGQVIASSWVRSRTTRGSRRCRRPRVAYPVATRARSVHSGAARKPQARARSEVIISVPAARSSPDVADEGVAVAPSDLSCMQPGCQLRAKRSVSPADLRQGGLGCHRREPRAPIRRRGSGSRRRHHARPLWLMVSSSLL